MSGSDLVTGTLDILILKTLRGRALHGYAIGRWIRDHSQGVLSVEEGALYPALHRLKGKGLLEARWGKTETGRRANFYELTVEGRKFLVSETRRWEQFSGAVAGILDEVG